MPNLSAVIKSEIIRLSRKTTREQLRPLQKASANYRHQIADLKRQTTALTRELSALRQSQARSPQAEGDSSISPKARFVAQGFRTLRNRLGLSLEECGIIVGVSAGTIFNWEKKRANPRPSQMPAIVALRGMTKRTAHETLQKLIANSNRSRK